MKQVQRLYRIIFLAVVVLATAPVVTGAALVSPHAVFIDHRHRTGQLTLANPGDEPEEIQVDFMFGLDESVPSYHWTVQEKYTGSSLLTGGCHAVDGLRYFMGQEPVEVHALYAKGWNKAFDYPATAVFMAQFPDGSVGKVISSLESQMPYRFRISLLGSEGSLFDNELYSKKFLPGQKDFATIPCTMLRSGETSGHPYPQVAGNLVDAILEDRPVGLDIFDAAKTHRVMFAADESAATGKPVALSL